MPSPPGLPSSGPTIRPEVLSWSTQLVSRCPESRHEPQLLPPPPPPPPSTVSPPGHQLCPPNQAGIFQVPQSGPGRLTTGSRPLCCHNKAALATSAEDLVCSARPAFSLWPCGTGCLTLGRLGFSKLCKLWLSCSLSDLFS